MKPQPFAVKILPAASAASFCQIVFLDRDDGLSPSGGFQLGFQRLDFFPHRGLIHLGRGSGTTPALPEAVLGVLFQ